MTEPRAVTTGSVDGIWHASLGRLTLGLVLVVVATAFEALAVATILPTTTAELGGLAWYGWTFSAFMLANLVGITVGGNETDRRGPALPFVAGTLLFSGGLVVSGFAPSMPVIVLGRTSQGFGGGLLSAVAYASIARAYATELQPRMLATLSSAWVVPGLVGPGLAGVIAEQLGWRWVFLGLAPLPIFAAFLVVPALRASARGNGDGAAPETGEDGARTRMAVQLALGASVALGGLGLDPRWLGVSMVVVGTLVSGHALQRLLPPGTLLARHGLPAAVATMALLNFAFFGTEAFVPLAIVDVRGAGVMLNGLSLTAAALTWTAGAWIQVRLATSVPRRTVIVGGLAILGVGIAGTLALVVSPVPAWTAVAAWAVAGFGMGLAFTTCSAAILEAAEPGQEGAASASLQLAQVLGAAIATGIGGAIVAAPFAGVPPARGIAVTDVLMLVVLAASIGTARGVAAERPLAPGKREGTTAA
jgi:MFS family permease